VALGVFTIHILGDVLSPFLIGVLSDATSLSHALQIVPIAVVVSGLIWALAARAQARTPTPPPPAAASS
jgi:hypothetical protein